MAIVPYGLPQRRRLSCGRRIRGASNPADGTIISGRVVLHAAVTDECVTSWAEVIVEEEAIPF